MKALEAFEKTHVQPDLSYYQGDAMLLAQDGEWRNPEIKHLKGNNQDSTRIASVIAKKNAKMARQRAAGLTKSEHLMVDGTKAGLTWSEMQAGVKSYLAHSGRSKSPNSLKGVYVRGNMTPNSKIPTMTYSDATALKHPKAVSALGAAAIGQPPVKAAPASQVKAAAATPTAKKASPPPVKAVAAKPAASSPVKSPPAAKPPAPPAAPKALPVQKGPGAAPKATPQVARPPGGPVGGPRRPGG